MTQNIALNTSRNGNKGIVRTMTIEDYDRLIREPWLKKLINEIRTLPAGDKRADALKAQLPWRCPHYTAFGDNHRRQANLLPKAFTFQTTFDVDDASVVEKAITAARELDTKPGRWRGKLLHMEYSARKKLHIDFRLPLGMTVEEAQQAYGEAIGVPYDKSCITPERFIYVTSIDDEIYRSKEWYQPLDDDDREMYVAAFRGRGLTDDGRMLAYQVPTAEATKTPKEETTHTQPTTCTEKQLRIFDLSREAAGLKDVDINRIGSRHTSLQAILSVAASRLMSEEELLAVVQQRMPEYAKEQDCRQLIHDFYAKYHDDSKIFNATVQRINALAEQEAGEGVSNLETAVTSSLMGNQTFSIPTPKAKPQYVADIENAILRLPALKATLAGVPEGMKIPVLCAVMPLAAAYADSVTVEYCDGKRMQLGLMSVIVGPQASGKSACKEALDTWLEKMNEDDEKARKQEDEWKEKRRNRKANEKAPEDPRVMIRNVPVTISCSTLLKRMKYAQGHTLFSFGEELDTLRKTNGAGSWSQKYDVYRLAFDNGVWGQDYNSDQAESGVVPVAYNFSILGTYGAFKRCFKRDNVENGLSSRIFIAEMPDATFAPMPLYGEEVEGLSTEVNAAVTMLRASHGIIDTPLLREAIGEWVERKRIEAMADGDIVKDTYRKRAAVIGFRCGVIARLLMGEENEKVLEFARLIAEYILEKQCNFFGEALLCEYKSAEQEMGKYSANGCIFDKLPPVFTINDLQKEKGSTVTRNVINNIIYRWKKSGWIEKKEEGKWMKTTQDKYKM